MNYIHETVIRDLIDVAHDFKKADALAGFMNRNNAKNLAADTSGLVCVFPVYVSSGISLKSAQIVSKAQERKATTMMRLAFAANLVTAGDSLNAKDILSKLHVNLKLDSSMTVDSVLDAFDKYVVQESAEGLSTKDIVSLNEFKKLIEADMKNINYTMSDSISESSINSFKIAKSAYGHTIVQEGPSDFHLDQDRRQNIDSFNAVLRSVDTVDKFDSEGIKRQLVDNDVKKSNELVETLLQVRVIKIADDGVPIPFNILIGIKAKMYVLDSMDVCNRIILKNKDGNSFTQLLRATTREISFFKDFLFAIDRAKMDALSQSNRGSSSKMWKVLERRSLKSRVKRFSGMQNDSMAITTLVVSQEEAEYIKKSANIAIDKSEVIRPIMEAYNLLSFVIVDEAMEVAKFIYDTGEDLYETISFKNLEKEAGRNDKELKEMIAVLSRQQR